MNTGGPAFPVVASTGDPRDGVSVQEGLTLRDYFAAKAMAAILQDAINTGESPQMVAKVAYETASAILAEREKANVR